MSGNNILKSILESVFYTNSMKKATRISKNSSGILELLKKVFSKLKNQGPGSALNAVAGSLLNLGKLLKYYATGQYRDIEIKNLVIILAGFIYFLSPIDLVPDFLPILGFADDIALITFIYSSLKEELEKFELWLLNNNLNN